MLCAVLSLQQGVGTQALLFLYHTDTAVVLVALTQDFSHTPTLS